MVSEIKIYRNDSIFKVNYLYDKNNLPVLISTYLIQSDESMQPFAQTEIFYQNNLIFQQTDRKWINLKWTDTAFTEFLYHNNNFIRKNKFVIINNDKIPVFSATNEFTNGNLSSNISQKYLSGNISSTQSTTNIYDNKSLILSDLDYKNQLVDSQKIRFVYKYADQQLTESTMQVRNIQNGWMNKSKTNFYYLNIGDSARLVRQKSCMWDNMNKKWINYASIQYAYDDFGNILSETYAHWQTMSWVETLKYAYVYNDLNQLISKKMQRPVYQKWRTVSSVAYNKPTALQLNIESKIDFWGGIAGTNNEENLVFNINGQQQIQKAHKLEISLLANNLVNVEDDKNNFVVYPNPSNGLFYTATAMKPSGYWKVFDAQGKLIQSNLQGNFSGVIDLSGEPAGIYILEAKIDQSVYRKKLIIQK